MKAARFHAPGEPLKIEELPDPQPGRGQVVAKVEACGICGSDVHFWEGHAPVAQTPITLGHEPAGTVETVGEDVDSIEPGQRVVVRAGSSCGRCAACRAGRDGLCERSQVLGMHIDGGLAERLLVGASELVLAPDAVPLEQAAIIGDAVATPYHALVERGGLRPGEAVAAGPSLSAWGRSRSRFRRPTFSPGASTRSSVHLAARRRRSSCCRAATRDGGERPLRPFAVHHEAIAAGRRESRTGAAPVAGERRRAHRRRT